MIGLIAQPRRHYGSRHTTRSAIIHGLLSQGQTVNAEFAWDDAVIAPSKLAVLPSSHCSSPVKVHDTIIQIRPLQGPKMIENFRQRRHSRDVIQHTIPVRCVHCSHQPISHHHKRYCKLSAERCLGKPTQPPGCTQNSHRQQRNCLTIARHPLAHCAMVRGCLPSSQTSAPTIRPSPQMASQRDFVTNVPP